jgi:hypothetical protein
MIIAAPRRWPVGAFLVSRQITQEKTAISGGFDIKIMTLLGQSVKDSTRDILDTLD